MHKVFAQRLGQLSVSAVLALGMLTVSPHWSTAADNSTLRYAGSVDINQTRVSFLLSGNAGGGVLHYRGRDYPFMIGGLGIGGIGVTKLEAKGEVYNLPSTVQFPGMYSQLRTGIAL